MRHSPSHLLTCRLTSSRENACDSERECACASELLFVVAGSSLALGVSSAQTWGGWRRDSWWWSASTHLLYSCGWVFSACSPIVHPSFTHRSSNVYPLTVHPLFTHCSPTVHPPLNPPPHLRRVAHSFDLFSLCVDVCTL